MLRIRLVMLVGMAMWAGSSLGNGQPPGGAKSKSPRLVPIAETKLLMEGLAHPNFQGIEKILRDSEIDADSWTFARGQSLLIAETGNLLMLRPPRNTGQDAWMKHAGELRESASELAQTIAERNRDASKARLMTLAHRCNSCHQSFRVTTRITAFEPPPKPPARRNP